ncbi:hypothetical protein TVAG_271610 [Trichomonas vaginalis G3]|uniref:HECT domain-containing protein n=1 Tax=Trichomonas vaginalis (strain ATCC PRA-98 / G3) TaxID=412133 RepID=A2E5Q8_TRIV3|nr:guanyl-nucleotide exchange factor protein [Trichomonas vaginalis G3]EAY11978.1 hypothetical protein TVAG_271610 [Trichomonas vaginalis G3]KAI5524857.1 guanyl-nucleotide exchange factor protein [Trichomonas vaginalis G3]|eukprot:XP_001324201.1 hypothetical protein [Trichomonas vaginalis G3]
MNDNSISVEKIMNFFKLNLEGLVKIFTTFLLYNDKILTTTLVDYDYNILDKSTPPKSAKLFQYKTAIDRIVDYLENSHKIDEFTEIYFNMLIERFNNVHFHSAIDLHPSAVVLNPKLFKSHKIMISRPDVTAWIAVRGCLDPTNEIICKINDEVLSNNVLILNTNKLTIQNISDQSYIVLIPFNEMSNESLIGTFIDLATSFKYFVRFISSHMSAIKPESLQMYRQKLYVSVFDSIIGNSSYFNTFGNRVLTFLTKNLPVLYFDITGEFLQRLNYIIKWNATHSKVFTNIIKEIEGLLRDRIFGAVKSFFPEFSDKSESDFLKSFQGYTKLILPSQEETIPFTITEKSQLDKILNYCKRLLLAQDMKSFPFYCLLHFWAIAAMKLPCFDRRILDNGKTLQIKFRYYIPKKFHFVFKQSNAKYEYLCSITKDGNKVKWTDEIETANHNEFFINLGNDASWSMLEFTIESDETMDAGDFILQYRDYLVSDMKMICERWNKNFDMAILKCIPSTTFESKEIELNFNPKIFANNPKLTGFPLALLYCRSIPLLIVNWMKNHNFIADSEVFNDFITPVFKLNSFLQIVSANSRLEVPNLKINRENARKLREGLVKDVKFSIISQIRKQIKISNLKNESDQPWKVKFAGENGLDMGGLARELVSEVSLDLRNPNCGFVCPTPNSISQVGYYRDKFIFVPTNNELRSNKKLYKSIGGLLLLIIRTGLVQEFDFAPVVWRFLVSNKVSIEDIYEIDVNYKNTIESLKDAINSRISEDEFNKQFNLYFVVKDSLGQDHSLNQNGTSCKVSISNANEYIALSNEFRIKELQKYLNWVRIGFLKNIKEGIPNSLDPDTLEFSCCGDPECSYENLVKIVRFEEISEDQQSIFFKVIQKFTPEQRACLIKFATGRSRLPPSGSSNQFKFTVDSNGAQIDKLPTSSTCFHTLHMPRYTSFDNAYKMISIAVENTESFENT